jgi:hypothetical protein
MVPAPFVGQVTESIELLMPHQCIDRNKPIGTKGKS